MLASPMPSAPLEFKRLEDLEVCAVWGTFLVRRRVQTLIHLAGRVVWRGVACVEMRSCARGGWLGRRHGVGTCSLQLSSKLDNGQGNLHATTEHAV